MNNPPADIVSDIESSVLPPRTSNEDAARAGRKAMSSDWRVPRLGLKIPVLPSSPDPAGMAK